METACSSLLITTKYIVTKLCQCISLANLPNSKCEPSSNTCTCESQAPPIREAWIHTNTCESMPHSVRKVIIMTAYVTKSPHGLISYFTLTKAKA